jgi:DNA-binding transcriptional LysR family regulator
VEFRQLIYFLRACDYGSVAAAAAHLGTVQSNVSMQISQLEHEFGADLCRRTSTRLVPTRAGERLYQLSQRLIAEIEFASRYMRSPLSEQPYPIAVAAMMAPRGSPMAEVLREVAQAIGEQQPNVNLRLVDFLAGSVSSDNEIGAVIEGNARCATFDPNEVPDRWALLSRRGQTSLAGDEMTLAELRHAAAGLRILMPEMPPGITELGKAFAAAARIDLAQEDISIQDIETSRFDSSQAILLPYACMPGFAAQQRFEVSFTVRTPHDPVWRVTAVQSADVRLAQAIAETFSIVMQKRLPGAGHASEAPTGAAAGRPDDKGYLLSLRELRSFQAVFERGNISRAAAEIGISQPAISNTVKKLEQALGHGLFVRTAHGVVPTDAGVVLHGISEPLLLDLGEARRQIRDLGEKGMSSIRIGILPVVDDESLLAVTISDAISEWTACSVNCELRLMEGFNSLLRRWTVDELLDFAVVDTEARQSGLIVTPLSRDAMVVVTSPKLGVLPPGPVKASDVPGLNLVLPSERHGLRGIIQKAFSEAGIAIEPKLEIDSMAMTLNLVKIGNWATVLPISSIYRRALSNELQVNVISDPNVTRGLSLIRRAGANPSTNAQRFADILAGRMRDASYSIEDLGEAASSKFMAPLTE